MENLSIAFTKKEYIIQFIVFLFLLIVTLIGIATLNEEDRSARVGLFLSATVFLLILIETIVFLRIKNPKIVFSKEGIYLNERLKGFIKWENIQYIHFVKQPRINKNTPIKYSSIYIKLKNNSPFTLRTFLNKMYKQYEIEVKTKQLKGTFATIVTIMNFIQGILPRYKRYDMKNLVRYEV